MSFVAVGRLAVYRFTRCMIAIGSDELPIDFHAVRTSIKVEQPFGHRV